MTATVTPFRSTSRAADVVAGLDLSGRRAIVTGGASGIGLETARALALAGAAVTLAVRDETAGVRAAADIAATTGAPAPLVARLDLADPASVGAFARVWDGPLHVLVANAGTTPGPFRRTPDGRDLHFATDHLGHFALATALWPALAAAEGARIVTLSSSAHLTAPIDLDDVDLTRRSYTTALAYGRAKTAAVLFAVGVTRRWAGDGITANAVNPGGVRTAARLRRGPDFDPDGAVRWHTVAQGAATPTLVATAPWLDGVSGRYFEDLAEASEQTPGGQTGYAAHAVDPASADRLWELSAAMVDASRCC